MSQSDNTPNNVTESTPLVKDKSSLENAGQDPNDGLAINEAETAEEFSFSGASDAIKFS